MDALRIGLKKKADGTAALSCRRADGSVTWQRQDADMAATYGAEHGVTLACHVTDGERATIRARQRELFTQWAALPAGATLELRFPRPPDGDR